jgi:hypothetical protein
MNDWRSESPVIAVPAWCRDIEWLTEEGLAKLRRDSKESGEYVVAYFRARRAGRLDDPEQVDPRIGS